MLDVINSPEYIDAINPEVYKSYLDSIVENKSSIDQYLELSQDYNIDLPIDKLKSTSESILKLIISLANELGMNNDSLIEQDIARLDEIKNSEDTKLVKQKVISFFVESGKHGNYANKFDKYLDIHDGEISLTELDFENVLLEISEVYELIRPKYKLYKLQGDLVFKSLDSGETDIDKYRDNPDISLKGIELLEMYLSDKQSLSVSQYDQLRLILGYLDSIGSFVKTQETSGDDIEISDQLDQNAEIIAKESNGSYLCILSRMISMGYLIDERAPDIKYQNNKSIRIRTYGKVINFVHRTSKRGMNLLQKGNRVGFKFFKEVLPTLIKAEQDSLGRYLSGSINDELHKSKIEELIKKLGRLGAELEGKSYDDIVKWLVDYEKDFFIKNVVFKNGYTRKALDGDIGIKGDKFASPEYTRQQENIETIKKELNTIEESLRSKKTRLRKHMQRMELYAKYNPEKTAEYRKQVLSLSQKTNNEMLLLQEQGVKKLTKLDDETLRSLYKSSKFVKDFFEFNRSLGVRFDNFKLSKSGKKARKLGKMMIGFGVVRMAVKGVQGFDNSENRWKDATDIGVGFIPFVGGVRDLSMFVRGKDFNGRDLSPVELGERLGFGLIGLVPGVGWLVKLSKGAKLTGKMTRGLATINKIGRIMEKTGAIYSYGALGLYGAMEFKELGEMGVGGLKWISKELGSNPDQGAATLDGYGGDIEPLPEQIQLTELQDKLGKIDSSKSWLDLSQDYINLDNAVSQWSEDMHEIAKTMIKSSREKVVQAKILAGEYDESVELSDLPIELFSVYSKQIGKMNYLSENEAFRLRSKDGIVDILPSIELESVKVGGEFIDTEMSILDMDEVSGSITVVNKYKDSPKYLDYIGENEQYVEDMSKIPKLTEAYSHIELPIDGLLYEKIEISGGINGVLTIDIRSKQERYQVVLPIISVIDSKGLIDITNWKFQEKVWDLYVSNI